MRRAHPYILPLILLVAACEPNPEPGATFIAPLHGQTDVAPATALRVHVGELQLPPDYPVPTDFIRVVDLATDGFVPGALRYEGDDVRFEPEGGWLAGHRYAWSVGELEPLDRAPEYTFPESVFGEAVFATSGDIDVLEATIDTDGRVCAILSRKLDAIEDELTITLDDEPVEIGDVSLHPEDLWVDTAVLDEGDEGVTVACFPDLVVSPGTSLRIWWADRGPWQATLEALDLAELLRERRRVHQ